jgi:hypothetical protein
MVLIVMRPWCASGIWDEYYIGFLNKTGHDLDEVGAYSNNKLLGPSMRLVAGGTVTEGPEPGPIPYEAEVRIIDHGKHRSVIVSLKDKPISLEDVTVYFVFNLDGSVQAKALKDGDQAGYAELIKGVRPEGEYRFGFVNRTGRDLQGVGVYYGQQKTASVVEIPSRAQANFNYSDALTNARPAEAELRWMEDSAPHAITVKLEGVVKGFEGIIFLVILPDRTVEVHALRNNQEKERIDLVK